ncbi:MAG: 50S ribosomal protein L30 [Candidatus Thermoplasmatota archaeon]|nr:50S ribosomal protein L30 [Candidatus Thermoplasmatota archaeon]MBS3789853.1 50S ribosomal protein L30 [Candidatus Thermoplasmatota archaeon]
MAYAVVRLKSSRDKKPKMKDTLKMLRLNSVNHCTVIPKRPAYKGMLNKVKDMVTWGEIDIDTMVDLLKNKSEMEESELEKKISEKTSYDDLEQLADAVTSDEITVDEIDGLDRVFRLDPPFGGYRSTKKPYNMGGALGYRGSEINPLIQNMLGPENTHEEADKHGKKEKEEE